MASQDRTPSSKPFKWLPNKNLRLNLSFNNKKTSKPSSPSSPNTQKSNNEIARDKTDELRQVFNRFDSDGDGKISAYELRAYFGSIGEHMSHEHAQTVINDVDSDGDGFLGFDDFLGMMMRRDLDGDDGGDLKMAFEMFELEKGSGCITPKGLQRMLNKLGDTKSYDECKAMIRVFDIDGNGVLDYHEFHQMMMA